MRVTARLTRSRDAVQIWADSFDGSSDAALSLQEDVAAAVARVVGTQIAGSAQKRLERRQAIDSEAYDLYLRGRFYWNQRTEVSLRQAADYFQQTISRAPGYAPAYAGLADSFAALVYGCYLAPAEGFPKVRAALQKGARFGSTSSGGVRLRRLHEHVFRLGFRRCGAKPGARHRPQS